MPDYKHYQGAAVGGGLNFQCLRFDWGNRLSHWKVREIFVLVKAKWASFVCDECIFWAVVALIYLGFNWSGKS